MSKIALSNGFVICPEGVHDFKITEVIYDEVFGKLEIKMISKEGYNISERYQLVGADGKPNNPALNSFSYFARVALNRNDIEEVDPNDLVGHFITAEVVHNEVTNRNDPTKTLTFANLKNKKACDGDGFIEPNSNMDIDSILS